MELTVCWEIRVSGGTKVSLLLFSVEGAGFLGGRLLCWKTAQFPVTRDCLALSHSSASQSYPSLFFPPHAPARILN